MIDLTFYVDSGEKSYVFETFDMMGVDYVKKELKFAVCNGCDKIYINGEQPEECCKDEGYTICKAGDITSDKWNFIIERKRGNDLVSSLDENHLYDQLERMTSLFESNVILVFEGRLEDLIVDPNNKQRVNQILSIPATCAQYGVSFIQVDHISTLVRMLKYFDYKCGTEPKIRQRFFRRSETLPKSVRILMSIRGIGEETARYIYEVYPTIWKLILDMSLDELKKIKNVGPKTKKLLWDWFFT